MIITEDCFSPIMQHSLQSLIDMNDAALQHVPATGEQAAMLSYMASYFIGRAAAEFMKANPEVSEQKKIIYQIHQMVEDGLQLYLHERQKSIN